MKFLCNNILVGLLLLLVSCSEADPKKINIVENSPKETTKPDWNSVAFDLLSTDTILTPSGRIMKNVSFSQDSNSIQIIQGCEFKIENKEVWTKGIELSIADTNEKIKDFYFEFSQSDSTLTSIIKL